MALTAIVGFEAGDTSECYTVAGTVSVQSSIKRTGNYALLCNPTGTNAGSATMSFPTSTGVPGFSGTAPLYHSFYFYAASLPASVNEQFASFGTSTGFALRLGSDGKIYAYNSTTHLTTGTTVLSTGVWYRIDVKIASAGWEVKVNGTSEISGVIDYTTSNRCVLGKAFNRNSNTVEFYYDDYVLDGAAYSLADTVKMILPNGNGTYTAFSNDYTNLDEIPHDSGTSYCQGTVDASKESVTLQSCADASISGTIVGVESQMIMAASGGIGTITENIFIKSGATENATADDTYSSVTYATRAKVYSTDTNTSVAWTTSGVDALEVGCQFVTKSADKGVRITSLRAMIAYTASAGGRPLPQRILTGPFNGPMGGPL